MKFVCQYYRDGDLHEKEFVTYENMLEWVFILKEQKARRIRKFLVTYLNEWYELK